jgi:hypothetical protein
MYQSIKDLTHLSGTVVNMKILRRELVNDYGFFECLVAYPRGPRTGRSAATAREERVNIHILSTLGDYGYLHI